jgi:hypothetical protein
MSDLSFLSEITKHDKTPENDVLKNIGTLINKLKILREAKPDENSKQRILSFFDNMEYQKDYISISTLEEVLKVYKEKEKQLSRDLIPTILNDTGLSEIKLPSGEKVIIEDVIKADIADKNIIEVFEEMIQCEMSDRKISYEEAKEEIENYFKKSVLLKNLDRETLNKTTKVLADENLPYDNKMEIHWQTLKAYVKNKLSTGGKIPEKINVFIYRETKLK